MSDATAFAIRCSEFNLLASGSRSVLLFASAHQPLYRSRLPVPSAVPVAGAYSLKASYDGKLIVMTPVTVDWLELASEPEPFLGVYASHTADLLVCLGAYRGRDIDMDFSRRPLRVATAATARAVSQL